MEERTIETNAKHEYGGDVAIRLSVRSRTGLREIGSYVVVPSKRRFHKRNI